MKKQREILPIPDQAYAGFVAYDAKDPETSFPAIEPLRPPAGAPNVLIVLLDDVGFGASSAFGGPANTPTAERLAANGLKYTRFDTTALLARIRQPWRADGRCPVCGDGRHVFHGRGIGGGIRRLHRDDESDTTRPPPFHPVLSAASCGFRGRLRKTLDDYPRVSARRSVLD